MTVKIEESKTKKEALGDNFIVLYWNFQSFENRIIPRDHEKLPYPTKKIEWNNS